MEDGIAMAEWTELESAEPGRSDLIIAVTEGRKRMVRRMLDKIGHPVKRLKRLAMGPVQLKGLAPGAWRPLRNDELQALARLRQQG